MPDSGTYVACLSFYSSVFPIVFNMVLRLIMMYINYVNDAVQIVALAC